MSEKACEVCGMPVHPDLERHAGACEVSVAARKIDAPRSLCTQLAGALGESRGYVEEYACGKPHPVVTAIDVALAAYRATGIEVKP